MLDGPGGVFLYKMYLCFFTENVVWGDSSLHPCTVCSEVTCVMLATVILTCQCLILKKEPGNFIYIILYLS